MEELISAALDALHIGVMIIDKDGAIMYANKSAKFAMRSSRGISMTRDGLTVKKLSGDIILRDHLRNGISVFNARPGRQTVTFLLVPTVGAHPSAPTAALYIGDPEQPTRCDVTRVSRMYSLTRGQSNVVARIGEGMSVEQAADQIGITYETARKHLKNAFKRLGVSRQSELMRMLVTGPASLDIGE